MERERQTETASAWQQGPGHKATAAEDCRQPCLSLCTFPSYPLGTEKPTVQTVTSTVTRHRGKMPKKRAWKNSQQALTAPQESRHSTTDVENRNQPEKAQGVPLHGGATGAKEKRATGGVAAQACGSDTHTGWHTP